MVKAGLFMALLIPLGLVAALPALAQPQTWTTGKDAPPGLPHLSQPTGGPVTRIVARGAPRSPMRVVLAPLSGSGELTGTVAATARRDFGLSGLLSALDSKLYTSTLAADGATGFDPEAWER